MDKTFFELSFIGDDLTGDASSVEASFFSDDLGLALFGEGFFSTDDFTSDFLLLDAFFFALDFSSFEDFLTVSDFLPAGDFFSLGDFLGLIFSDSFGFFAGVVL